jgi:hypothetical protein
LGEKAKRFTNVFIKNFGEELSEQDLTDMFAKYGKISSIKVLLLHLNKFRIIFNCGILLVETRGKLAMLKHSFCDIKGPKL